MFPLKALLAQAGLSEPSGEVLLSLCINGLSGPKTDLSGKKPSLQDVALHTLLKSTPIFQSKCL